MKQEKEIRMIVFDWAGTTVDYGSFAPMTVFERVFQREGICLTREEINKPMGLEKKAHIRALLSEKNTSEKWMKLHGKQWEEQDVERLYENFEQELHQVVGEYSEPLDGVVETVEKLRKAGLKIGSTTGYNAWMMEQVIPKAGEKGYCPDCVITPDDTGIGRPSPFMVFECMRRMGVYPAKNVIKAGDTIADILEGRNAGAWSVGILTGSNLLGLSREEYHAADPQRLREKKEEARKKYMDAGADLVIDTFSELPDAVAEINRRMQMEEKEDESVL